MISISLTALNFGLVSARLQPPKKSPYAFIVKYYHKIDNIKNHHRDGLAKRNLRIPCKPNQANYVEAKQNAVACDWPTAKLDWLIIQIQI